MKARHVLLLAGSLWEFVRFFLVLFIFATVFQVAQGADSWVFPWLLVMGPGNLLVAAGGGMLALFPVRYAPIIFLLRLGKVLSVSCFVLLVASGATRLASGDGILGIGGRAISGRGVLLGVFLLDLLFLAVLISWHSDEPHTLANGPGV
jgi:hypothetical protein